MPIFIHFEPLVSRINENLEFHEYKKVQEKEQHFQDMINCPIYILVKEQNNETKNFPYYIVLLKLNQFIHRRIHDIILSILYSSSQT
ncbi:MAG: hypothetical protein QXI89_02090, partial [Candidatus Anstonellales archaeon]